MWATANGHIRGNDASYSLSTLSLFDDFFCFFDSERAQFEVPSIVVNNSLYSVDGLQGISSLVPVPKQLVEQSGFGESLGINMPQDQKRRLAGASCDVDVNSSVNLLNERELALGHRIDNRFRSVQIKTLLRATYYFREHPRTQSQHCIGIHLVCFNLIGVVSGTTVTRYLIDKSAGSGKW